MPVPSIGYEDLMPKAIVTPDQDAIIAEIDIAAPPGRVFEALTDSDQLLRWFTDASCPVKFWQMDARLGGKYSYATSIHLPEFDRATRVGKPAQELIRIGKRLEDTAGRRGNVDLGNDGVLVGRNNRFRHKVLVSNAARRVLAHRITALTGFCSIPSTAALLRFAIEPLHAV